MPLCAERLPRASNWSRKTLQSAEIDMGAWLRSCLHRAQLAGEAPASSPAHEILHLLDVQFLAQDRPQSFTFLFRLGQLRNNCGNFLEYLVPALFLAAGSCAFHSFISSVGEFRLAVSEILKDGHVERTVNGLMFYS